MMEKRSKREAVAKNAAIRYENGGAPAGPKVSLACPKETADALRARAIEKRMALSRLLDNILREYLGMGEREE